jgi:hypothetical protein
MRASPAKDDWALQRSPLAASFLAASFLAASFLAGCFWPRRFWPRRFWPRRFWKVAPGDCSVIQHLTTRAAGAIRVRCEGKHKPSGGIKREHPGAIDDQNRVPKAVKMLQKQMKNNQMQFSVAPMMDWSEK